MPNINIYVIIVYLNLNIGSFFGSLHSDDSIFPGCGIHISDSAPISGLRKSVGTFKTPEAVTAS